MKIGKTILKQDKLIDFIRENPILNGYRVDLHQYTSCIVYTLKLNDQTVSYAIIYSNDNGVEVPNSGQTDTNFNYYLVWIQTNKDTQGKGYGKKLINFVLNDIPHPILLLSLHQNIYLFAKLWAYLL